MAEKLGILVSSEKHLDYVINLTEAAHKKDKEVEIFFTGKGVLLTQSSDFKKLVGKAKMTLCDVSFRALKLKGDVPGLGFKGRCGWRCGGWRLRYRRFRRPAGIGQYE